MEKKRKETKRKDDDKNAVKGSSDAVDVRSARAGEVTGLRALKEVGIVKWALGLKTRYKVVAVIVALSLWFGDNLLSTLMAPFFDEAAIVVRDAGADARNLFITPDGIEAEHDLIQADKVLKRGHGDAAVGIIRRLIDQHGEHAEFYYDLGRVFERMGLPDSAIYYYEIAYDLDMDLEWNRRHLGELQLRLGEFGDAIPHLEFAADCEKEDAQIHLNLALAYRGAGLVDKADTALRRATEIRPNIPGAGEFRDSTPKL